MKDEQSDIEMAIASSCNAYFAHRAYMQPTPAFLRLFSDAFQLGADYAMDAAPQPPAAPPGEQDAARLEFAMHHGQPMERDGWFRYHGFVEQGWFGTKLEALDAAIAAKGRTDRGEPA